MKNVIKLLVIQAVIVSFCIVFGNAIISVIAHFLGHNITYSWYFPASVILTGILSALPTLIFYIKRLPFIAKIIIHFVLLLGVISLAQIIFGLSFELLDMISLYSIFIITYGLVWIISYQINKLDERNINKLLEESKDSE